MKEGYLQEIEDTGVGFLKVHVNILKEKDSLLKDR